MSLAHNSLEYMAMELLSTANNVPAKTLLIMFFKVIKNTLILFNVIFQCCDHQAFPLHLTYGGSYILSQPGHFILFPTFFSSLYYCT